VRRISGSVFQADYVYRRFARGRFLAHSS
jgi:hypothetical protein